MKRSGHEDTIYFLGGEVEKTPAYSKKTLFVVGIQDTEQVERMAREYKVPHVFLGANHSFDALHYTEHFGKTWDNLIATLLAKGFWVTLDYPAHQHKTVLKMLSPEVWQSRQFVPLLSVRIPNIETSSPNLTVKIDDIDFNATNRGVWCMHFHEVTDSNRFTDWQEYATDRTIAPLAGPAHILPLKISKSPSVYADINKPEINLNSIKDLIEKEKAVSNFEIDGDVKAVKEGFESAILNDGSLGLDIESKSKLKPEPDAQEETKINVIDSPAAAAEAYAEGSKEDALSKPTPKKAKVVRKEST